MALRLNNQFGLGAEERKTMSATDNAPMMLENETPVISTLNGVTGRRYLPALTKVFVQPPPPVTDEMVNRFLAWELPKDFWPDGGVTFTREVGTMDGKRDRADLGPGWWPIGTNILTADQARAMLEHVLADPTAIRG